MPAPLTTTSPSDCTAKAQTIHTLASTGRAPAVIGPKAAIPSDHLQPGTRALLAAFAALTLAATNQLYVLARRTDQLFSWTVSPPLSAAFLGASYGAGCVLTVLAFRSRSWRAARGPLAAVLVFAVLTLAATLLHLDRFHFAAPGPVARGAAWVWLGVYVVVPVALGVVVLRQRRQAAAPPTTGPALAPWMCVLLRVQGGVLGLSAAGLFLIPARAGAWWPWTLTPLTARMTAAWLAALALAALLGAREGDRRGVRILAITYAVFAVLQLGAVLRFGDVVAWGRPAATGYVAALVVALGTGVVGVAATRERRSSEEEGA